MSEELQEQKNNSKPWLYKKGQSGNPAGRPKGTFSMKEYIKKKMARMTDEEREVFLEGIDKKTIWEMGEGKAETKTDITSDGKALPQPLLYNVLTNDSAKEDSETKEED